MFKCCWISSALASNGRACRRMDVKTIVAFRRNRTLEQPSSVLVDHSFCRAFSTNLVRNKKSRFKRDNDAIEVEENDAPLISTTDPYYEDINVNELDELAVDEELEEDDADKTNMGEEEKDESCNRNMAIVEVIRKGLENLNNTASRIQSESQTKRSLFVVEEDPILAARKESNKNFLLQIAQSSLAELSLGKGILSMGGEPMQIVEAKMRGNKEAILYWCLPMQILMSETYSKLDKQYFEFRLHKHLTEEGGERALQMKMHQTLHRVYGFPPTVKLEPATNEQLAEIIQIATESTPEVNKEQVLEGDKQESEYELNGEARNLLIHLQENFFRKKR